MTFVRLPILAVLAMGLTTGVALVTRDAGAQSTQQAPAASQNFSAGQLESFAKATVEVQEISATYQPKLRSADDAQVQQQLRRAQANDMIEAVTQAGLSVEQYNAIHAAYRNDPETASRIDRLISQVK